MNRLVSLGADRVRLRTYSVFAATLLPSGATTTFRLRAGRPLLCQCHTILMRRLARSRLSQTLLGQRHHAQAIPCARIWLSVGLRPIRAGLPLGLVPDPRALSVGPDLLLPDWGNLFD